MVRKMLLLTWLSFILAIGGFCALRAQDPAPQTPTTMPAQRQTTTATTTQADLSGTYSGTFNCEAAGLVGDTTLTINGNEFTTADGKSGRITASKTAGYTAVALQVNATDPAAAPMIVSMRARKSGNKLTLSPVAGAMHKCSFMPGRSMARNRRNRQPAATGTEVANPTATPAESPMTMPMQTPSPSPSPTPSGSPTPMPSPEASPSPSPSEPMPSPTPSPSPSPSYVR